MAAKSTGLPVSPAWCSISGKDRRTMMGVTRNRRRQVFWKPEPMSSARIAARHRGVRENLRAVESYGGGHPVWIKANAGCRKSGTAKSVYTTTAVEFAGHVPAVLEPARISSVVAAERRRNLSANCTNCSAKSIIYEPPAVACHRCPVFQRNWKCLPPERKPRSLSSTWKWDSTKGPLKSTRRLQGALMDDHRSM